MKWADNWWKSCQNATDRTKPGQKACCLSLHQRHGNAKAKQETRRRAENCSGKGNQLNKQGGEREYSISAPDPPSPCWSPPSLPPSCINLAKKSNRREEKGKGSGKVGEREGARESSLLSSSSSRIPSLVSVLLARFPPFFERGKRRRRRRREGWGGTRGSRCGRPRSAPGSPPPSPLGSSGSTFPCRTPTTASSSCHVISRNSKSSRMFPFHSSCHRNKLFIFSCPGWWLGALSVLFTKASAFLFWVRNLMPRFPWLLADLRTQIVIHPLNGVVCKAEFGFHFFFFVSVRTRQKSVSVDRLKNNNVHSKRLILCLRFQCQMTLAFDAMKQLIGSGSSFARN